jgi:hypothetical protein
MNWQQSLDDFVNVSIEPPQTGGRAADVFHTPPGKTAVEQLSKDGLVEMAHDDGAEVANDYNLKAITSTA